MSKTYTTLARAHHELYQTFSDYDAEFRAYHQQLRREKCKRILEIGCGSANLANRFLEASYDYVGLDNSKQFLAIGRKMTPRAKFVLRDMRKFTLRPRFDAVLITGRTMTHMTTNADVLAALRCAHGALRAGGVLLFDNFDAQTIFTNKKRRFVNAAVVGERRYRRVSVNTMLPERGWLWRWASVWTITEKRRKRTIHDERLLRAFTPDELRLWLTLSGFEHVETTQNGPILRTKARRA